MIGERIKQARKAAGLSMRALAEKAGISPMAISKYETNKITPSSAVLLALARSLNLKVEYFFRTTNVKLQEVEYRKHARLAKKVLSKIEGDVIEQIERYIDLEDILPNSPIGKFKLPKNLPAKVKKLDEIETVAQKIRQVWKLGNNPIPDLIDTLEERGIKVFQSNALHDDKFDGLAAHVNGTPVIVIGRDWPGDRQRFTMAHELGHLVLKDRLPHNMDEEKAANRFAGAFLVPASEVIKELGEKRNWLEAVELCVLKQTYGLSMAGWIHRASDLGVINSAVTRRMWEHFRAKKWLKREPGEQFPVEKPKLFIQLVFHAYGEELISDSKAAELLGCTVSEFRNIRNVGSCEHQAVNN